MSSKTKGGFEDYCRQRWDMGRRHAYELIDASRVAEKLCAIAHIVPTSERQARPLTTIRDGGQP